MSIRVIEISAGFLRRHAHLNWTFADQAMVSGANFLTTIIVARVLGIEEFGRYAIAWLVVLFANSIHTSINTEPMMSIGAQQPASAAPSYFMSAWVQQLLFSFVAGAFVLLGASLADKIVPKWGMSDIALPMAFATVGFQYQDFVRRYFFTRGRPVSAFINDALRYIGQIALLVVLFLTTNLSPAEVLWVIAGCAFLAAISGWASMGRLSWDRRVFQDVIRRHWRSAKFLVLSALLMWFCGYFFTVAAGAVLGAASIAAVTAVGTLLGILNILFMGLENVVPIRAASHYVNGGYPALVAYLQKIVMFGSVATTTVAIVAVAAPAFWLHSVFGQEFAEYGFLLRWMAPFTIFHLLIITLHAGFRAIELTKPIFNSYVAAAIFSVVTAYPLVQNFGLNGVIIGKISVDVIELVVLLSIFRRYLSRS